MKHLMFIVLVFMMLGCTKPEIKEIEVKYNDRSEFITQSNDRVDKVPNNQETIKLKKEISEIKKEFGVLNDENKSCQINSNNKDTEIADLKEQLKKAEFALGFWSAFKYSAFALGGIIFLVLLLKFTNLKSWIFG